MKWMVEEMKGVAGVDEKTVTSQVVEAEDEGEALALARDYHGMMTAEAEVHNGAGKFNHYLMASPRLNVCAYCDRELVAGAEHYDSDLTPGPEDDGAWDRIKLDHAADCEWVLSRAHRRPAPTEKTKYYVMAEHCVTKGAVVGVGGMVEAQGMRLDSDDLISLTVDQARSWAALPPTAANSFMRMAGRNVLIYAGVKED
jgi:hypothetical protein